MSSEQIAPRSATSSPVEGPGTGLGLDDAMLGLKDDLLQRSVNRSPLPALDLQPVTAQDGLGQQATALLTLAFLLAK
jgi:hypothetical protein